MEWRLFDGVPDADVRAVLSLARRRTFRRGEVVFHRGDAADSVHLISKGRFDVSIGTALGDVIALAIRGPGDTFGELALLTGEERTATVTALEPGETLVVRASELRRLAQQHHALDEVLVRLLAEQVQRLSELLVEAYTVDADERVVRRLLELVRVYGGRPPVTVPLRQEDLAALAGSSRATVNRVLRRAERDGLVELHRGRTLVLDPEALRRRTGLGGGSAQLFVLFGPADAGRPVSVGGVAMSGPRFACLTLSPGSVALRLSVPVWTPALGVALTWPGFTFAGLLFGLDTGCTRAAARPFPRAPACDTTAARSLPCNLAFGAERTPSALPGIRRGVASADAEAAFARATAEARGVGATTGARVSARSCTCLTPSYETPPATPTAATTAAAFSARPPPSASPPGAGRSCAAARGTCSEPDHGDRGACGRTGRPFPEGEREWQRQHRQASQRAPVPPRARLEPRARRALAQVGLEPAAFLA